MGCWSANSLLVNVKFLSLLIAQKNGIVRPAPKFLLSEKEGGSKPVLLSTEGSGWERRGK